MTSFKSFRLEDWHFLQKGGPNLQKVGVDKTVTPYFGNKKFDPITDTPYPLNRLKLY